jgi:hypothetical protein
MHAFALNSQLNAHFHIHVYNNIIYYIHINIHQYVSIHSQIYFKKNTLFMHILHMFHAWIPRLQYAAIRKVKRGSEIYSVRF